MAKARPWIRLTVLLAVLMTVSFTDPHLLDDQNKFLAGFVDEDLLSILGFIVAVTLASSASIQFELNRIEDVTGKAFVRARASLRKSAYSLIVLFGAAGILVVVKPVVPNVPRNLAVANSLAISIVFFNLSVMLDLTRTVFKIRSITAISGAG